MAFIPPLSVLTKGVFSSLGDQTLSDLHPLFGHLRRLCFLSAWLPVNDRQLLARCSWFAGKNLNLKHGFKEI